MKQQQSSRSLKRRHGFIYPDGLLESSKNRKNTTAMNLVVKSKEQLKEYRELQHLYMRLSKRAIFEHYGGNPPKCACCGETTLEFLTIDHVNGGGNKHRKEIGGGGNFYRWLVKNDFPEGFQVLCMNCNWAKGKYGECPHQKQQQKT